MEKNKSKSLRYLFIIICFIALQAFTQDIAIGQWRTHLPYYNVKSISEGNGKVYCATVADLFVYDTEDASVEKMSKVSGLSGVGIQFLEYNMNKSLLFVAYEDGNIDLIKEDKIINISAVKEKLVAGDKSFNSVSFYEDEAYISTNLGIIVVDLENAMIKETYIIGENGAVVNVFATAVLGEKIYAATREGLKEADYAGSNLIDFNSWLVHDQSKGIAKRIVNDLALLNDTLFLLTLDSVFKYNGANWQFVYSRKSEGYDLVGLNAGNNVLIIDEELDTSSTVVSSFSVREGGTIVNHVFDRVINAPKIVIDSSGTIWIGSENWGLSEKLEDGIRPIIPDGPKTVHAFSLYSADGKLWCLPGGYDAAWAYKFLNTGLYRFWKGNWEVAKPEGSAHIRDYVVAAEDPRTKHIYFGSFHDGLLEYYQGEVVNVYTDNSSLQVLYTDGPYLVSGLDFDSNDALWISNFGATSPLSVKTQEGVWSAFKPTGTAKDVIRTGELVIDQADQKWVIVRNDGLMVFNDGGTLDDLTDDQWTMVKSGEGSGGLPSVHVNCIAVDDDGEIWVGTSEGLGVIYCPENVFSDGGCEAQQITVEYDGYTGHLFEGDNIKSIEIDGANRKWIGTESGVWLLSEDGTEEVYSFNESNSPLLSNDIIDIDVLGETGEVFFATSLGIVSYKSTSTEGKYIQDNDVLVYPNPVRETYDGVIAIRGLVDNAEVKITDIKGQLVHETISLGGQAIWNGKLQNGDRASTGVYVVWSANKLGKETFVAKILMIN